MVTPLCWNLFDAVNFGLIERPIVVCAYLLKSMTNGRNISLLRFLLFLPLARSAMLTRREG
jgi:hypothetical protein